MTYAIVKVGNEKFMLVQPIAGNLKSLLDQKGEGTIYRHCYSTKNIKEAYDQLTAHGLQPEDENGRALSKESLQSPAGMKIIWLPKRFGELSIEILEEEGLNRFLLEAFDGCPS